MKPKDLSLDLVSSLFASVFLFALLQGQPAMATFLSSNDALEEFPDTPESQGISNAYTSSASGGAKRVTQFAAALGANVKLVDSEEHGAYFEFSLPYTLNMEKGEISWDITKYHRFAVTTDANLESLLNKHLRASAKTKNKLFDSNQYASARSLALSLQGGMMTPVFDGDKIMFYFQKDGALFATDRPESIYKQVLKLGIPQILDGQLHWPSSSPVSCDALLSSR